MTPMPFPCSFELHLWTDPDFTRKGWGRKVRKLGGNFRPARGYDDTRYVFVPDSPEGRALIGELLLRFKHARTTTVIIRSPETRVLHNSESWHIVHYVKATDDPHTAIEGVVQKFVKLWNRFQVREFRRKSHAWFTRRKS